MNYCLLLLSFLLLQAACQSGTETDQQSNLDETLRFRFLSPEQGQQAITRDSMEGFFEKVTSLELRLQLRLPNSPLDRPALLQAYREQLRSEVLPFSEEEQQRLQGLLTQAKAACAAKNLDWDMPQIDLIKIKSEHYDPTTYYTRDQCIVIPQDALKRFGDKAILATLLHEIFHIYSRYHPEKRQALYQVIGFEPLDTVAWSPFLQERMLHNPDGLDLYYAIELEDRNGRSFSAVPAIYSKSPSYHPRRSRFFDYVQFELFEVAKDSLDIWRIVPERRGLPPEQSTSFGKQIGPNTQYIIHPDEILADNFVLLMLDGKVPEEGLWLQKELAKILCKGDGG